MYKFKYNYSYHPSYRQHIVQPCFLLSLQCRLLKSQHHRLEMKIRYHSPQQILKLGHKHYSIRLKDNCSLDTFLWIGHCQVTFHLQKGN